LRAGSDRTVVELVDGIDVQIRHVAVGAKLARGRCIWATTKHEDHLCGAAETPVPRFDQLEPTAVHHLVIGRRGHRNGPTEMIRPKPRKYVQDVPGRSG
jgi:hypothetical protein